MSKTHIVLHDPEAALAETRDELIALKKRADEADDAAVPPNTRRAYELELHCFASWCNRRGFGGMKPVPPEVVRLYLRELADKGRDPSDLPRGKPRGPFGYSALLRALSAICHSNVESGHESIWNDPVIIKARDAFASEKTKAPKKKKRGIGSVESLLVRVCDQMDDSVRGIRDRALILVGWTGGRRRSEIVAACVKHFEFTEKGNAIWTIPRSKTDQGGKGHKVLLPLGQDARYCPVRALQRWLEISKIENGYVFRGVDMFTGEIMTAPLAAEGVSQRVKHYVKLLGLDPNDFGGHSLRRGFITTASKMGRSVQDIMKVTGHTDPKTLFGYVEEINLEEESAAKGLLDESLARKGTSTETPEVSPPTFRRLVRPIQVEVQVTMADAISPFFGDRPFARELLDLADWIESGLVEFEIVSIKHALSDGWTDRVLSFRDRVRATGKEEHQTLCAIGWMFAQEVLGIQCHSRGGSACAYAGGWADVAAEDGSFFIECGTTNVDNVPKAMAAGQTVLVLPYGFSGKTVRKEDEAKLLYQHSSTQSDMQPGFMFVPKDAKKIASLVHQANAPLFEKVRKLRAAIAADMPGLEKKSRRGGAT